MANKNTKTETVVEETTAPAKEATAPAKKAVAKKDRNSEIVQIKLFQDGGKYNDDVTVIHNGKAYRIQRGQTVKVPRAVALILERSMRQDTATAQLIAREAEKAKKI